MTSLRFSGEARPSVRRGTPELCYRSVDLRALAMVGARLRVQAIRQELASLLREFPELRERTRARTP